MTDHEVTCGTCGSSSWMMPNQNGDVFCQACYQDAMSAWAGTESVFKDHCSKAAFPFSMGTMVKQDDVEDLG
jgi:hypothetical protein